MDLQDIPGYKEALAEERELRGRVCIGIPFVVCGVHLRLMTLRDYVNLQALRSPFVAGGFVRRTDCLQILCYMQTGYREPKQGLIGRFLARRRNSEILKLVQKFDTLQLIAGINEYIDAVFLDSPASSVSAGESSPIASSTASIIDQLGSSYGWSIDEMMDVELPLVFQLFRIRHLMEGGKRSALINRRSSKVIGEYLRTVNAQ